MEKEKEFELDYPTPFTKEMPQFKEKEFCDNEMCIANGECICYDEEKENEQSNV